MPPSSEEPRAGPGPPFTSAGADGAAGVFFSPGGGARVVLCAMMPLARKLWVPATSMSKTVARPASSMETMGSQRMAGGGLDRPVVGWDTELFGRMAWT